VPNNPILASVHHRSRISAADTFLAGLRLGGRNANEVKTILIFETVGGAARGEKSDHCAADQGGNPNCDDNDDHDRQHDLWLPPFDPLRLTLGVD